MFHLFRRLIGRYKLLSSDNFRMYFNPQIPSSIPTPPSDEPESILNTCSEAVLTLATSIDKKIEKDQRFSSCMSVIDYRNKFSPSQAVNYLSSIPHKLDYDWLGFNYFPHSFFPTISPPILGEWNNYVDYLKSLTSPIDQLCNECNEEHPKIKCPSLHPPLFWNQNKDIFPELFKIAQHILAIPHNTIRVESSFSHLKAFQRKKSESITT